MRVFVSHASADLSKVAIIDERLRAAGASTRLDRSDLQNGQSFVRFMSEGVSDVDHFLLLWSRAAASSPWVAVEWEAALVRAVEERRAFLWLARLEEVELPAVLKPRRYTDLFPSLEPGLTELTKTIEADATAARSKGRPIVPGSCLAQQDGRSVYLSSQLFGVTLWITLAPTLPSLALLDRIIGQLDLPRRVAYGDRIGMLFEYTLVHENKKLDAVETLDSRQIRDGAILELEVRAIPFAASSPIAGAMETTLFRTIPQAELHAEAERVLRAALQKAKLDTR